MDLASEISESSSLVSEDLRTLDGSVDGEPRADGLYEERFRVDRRKLESMLLGKPRLRNYFKCVSQSKQDVSESPLRLYHVLTTSQQVVELTVINL